MRVRDGIVVAVVVAVATVSMWYARPILGMRRIGIAWWASRRALHCTEFRGEVACTTAWPPTPYPVSVTTINYRRMSRRLLRADRTYNLTDSSAWARVVESTRRAMADAGREPLPCDTTVTRFPIAEAWREGAYEIRLYAASRMPVREFGMRRFASVQLVPFGAAGCGPRYVVRLLTPAEIAAAAREWFVRQIGLQ